MIHRSCIQMVGEPVRRFKTSQNSHRMRTPENHLPTEYVQGWETPLADRTPVIPPYLFPPWRQDHRGSKTRRPRTSFAARQLCMVHRMKATYHCIRFGPSSVAGATFLSFLRSIPTFWIAAPMFSGKFPAICFRTMLASLGPLPLVLTMI